MVGLQKRFSTITRLLKRHHLLRKARSYTYRYCTGPYPEGDPITELFIHPVDNAIQLFGAVESVQVQKTNHGSGITFQLLLKHSNNVHGMMELSSGYSWNNSFETLEINTNDQIVFASYPNELKTIEKPATILNVPIEKVISSPSVHKVYFNNNGFIPGASQNSLVVQGFYPEIKHFLFLAESGKNDGWGNIESLLPSYIVLDRLALASETDQTK